MAGVEDALATNTSGCEEGTLGELSCKHEQKPMTKDLSTTPPWFDYYTPPPEPDPDPDPDPDPVPNPCWNISPILAKWGDSKIKQLHIHIPEGAGPSFLSSTFGKAKSLFGIAFPFIYIRQNCKCPEKSPLTVKVYKPNPNVIIVTPRSVDSVKEFLGRYRDTGRVLQEVCNTESVGSYNINSLSNEEYEINSNVFISAKDGSVKVTRSNRTQADAKGQEKTVIVEQHCAIKRIDYTIMPPLSPCPLPIKEGNYWEYVDLFKRLSCCFFGGSSVCRADFTGEMRIKDSIFCDRVTGMARAHYEPDLEGKNNLIEK